jgi:hypothetical protein
LADATLANGTSTNSPLSSTHTRSGLSSVVVIVPDAVEPSLNVNVALEADLSGFDVNGVAGDVDAGAVVDFDGAVVAPDKMKSTASAGRVAGASARTLVKHAHVNTRQITGSGRALVIRYNSTVTTDPALRRAIESVPAGAWAVGVSGGADSVALLTLLCERPDVRPHVVHLNHQTRGDASDGDAAFVRSLASQYRLDATVESLDRVFPTLGRRPTNKSSLFRAARLTLFRRVVEERKLAGVILAHHRLDQAETVLIRLAAAPVRPGSGAWRCTGR